MIAVITFFIMLNITYLRDYIIIDVDYNHDTGPILHQLFQDWQLSGVYYTSLDSLSHVFSYRTLWLLAGIYSNNTQIPGSSGEIIEEFLQTVPDACLYLEGGDLWGFDPTVGYWNPLPWTGIEGAVDSGFGDMVLVGVENTLIPQFIYQTAVYTGEYSWMDQFWPYEVPPFGGVSEVVLIEGDYPHEPIIRSIAYDQGTWRTLSMVMEAGDLTGGSLQTEEFIYQVAKFFKLNPIKVEENTSFTEHVDVKLMKNGLVISLPFSNLLYLRVFDSSGRRVWNTVSGPAKNITIEFPELPAGVYRVVILSKNLKKVVPFVSFGRK